MKFKLLKDIGDRKKGEVFDCFGGLVCGITVGDGSTVRFDEKKLFKLIDNFEYELFDFLNDYIINPNTSRETIEKLKKIRDEHKYTTFLNKTKEDVSRLVMRTLGLSKVDLPDELFNAIN